jgi:hypothetical protein
VPNEPRAKENYKALPGGDVPVKQPAKIAPKPAEDGDEDEG